MITQLQREQVREKQLKLSLEQKTSELYNKVRVMSSEQFRQWKKDRLSEISPISAFAV